MSRHRPGKAGKGLGLHKQTPLTNPAECQTWHPNARALEQGRGRRVQISTTRDHLGGQLKHRCTKSPAAPHTAKGGLEILSVEATAS